MKNYYFNRRHFPFCISCQRFLRYNFDDYLAHIGDKNYIYSDASSDNDFHMFCTWDVNGDTPKIVEELSGTEVDYEYIEECFENLLYAG